MIIAFGYFGLSVV